MLEIAVIALCVLITIYTMMTKAEGKVITSTLKHMGGRIDLLREDVNMLKTGQDITDTQINLLNAKAALATSLEALKHGSSYEPTRPIPPRGLGAPPAVQRVYGPTTDPITERTGQIDWPQTPPTTK